MLHRSCIALPVPRRFRRHQPVAALPPKVGGRTGADSSVPQRTLSPLPGTAPRPPLGGPFSWYFLTRTTCGAALHRWFDFECPNRLRPHIRLIFILALAARLLLPIWGYTHD